MDSNDPYKILGLDKNNLGKDKNQTIAKAYRKLAFRWHPDKNNNDKLSETKFKKISMAYQKLINPERYPFNNNVFTPKFNEEKLTKLTENIMKKSKKFSAWIEQMKGLNFVDLTDNFIKEATRYKTFYDEVVKPDNKINKTDNIILNIKVKLSDIYNNEKKILNIKRTKKCKTCLGNGMTVKGICKECNGNNYCVYNKTIELYPYQKQIILKGESNEEAEHVAGDIILNIIPKTNELFKIINNNDILYQIIIEKTELNKEYSIEYLDGNKYNVILHNIIFNKLYKIEGLGIYNTNKTRGDLFIQPLLKNTCKNLLNNSISFKKI